MFDQALAYNDPAQAFAMAARFHERPIVDQQAKGD